MELVKPIYVGLVPVAPAVILVLALQTWFPQGRGRMKLKMVLFTQHVKTAIAVIKFMTAIVLTTGR